MKVKDITIVLLIVVILVLGSLYLLKQGGEVVVVGGAAGPEHTELQQFYGGHTGGGNVLVPVQTNGLTANGISISAAEFCNNSVVLFAPQTTAASTTLPTGAALTQGCLRQVGSYKDIIVRNTTTTAASTITIRGNTSSTLIANQAASSSTVIPAANQVVWIRAVWVQNSSSGAAFVNYFVNWFKNN